MSKKLTKSSNKILCGICGGLAEYFNLDPTIMRIIYVLISILLGGFGGLIIYLILYLIMPKN